MNLILKGKEQILMNYWKFNFLYILNSSAVHLYLCVQSEVVIFALLYTSLRIYLKLRDNEPRVPEHVEE